MTPVLDREFANLAAERTARNPLRTYIFVPAGRIAAMWFTPRIELLPYSGKLWPPGERWRGNPTDFGVTAGFGLEIVYLALAAVGWWRYRSRIGGDISSFVRRDPHGGYDAVADCRAAVRDRVFSGDRGAGRAGVGDAGAAKCGDGPGEQNSDAVESGRGSFSSLAGPA